jgi:prepilin signal peptidase PulO-like enzyme (type II secretory pathway)
VVQLARPAPRGWRRLLACAFAALLLILLLSLPRGAPASRAHALQHATSPGLAAMDSGMQMSFYWSTRVTLWFDGWTTSGGGEYALALAGLAALGVAQEALHVARAHAAGCVVAFSTRRASQPSLRVNASPLLRADRPASPHPAALAAAVTETQLSTRCCTAPTCSPHTC